MYDHSIYTYCYQIFVGNLNCIAMCTHPNLTPGVAFLSAYNHHPSPDHLKSELYALWYINSTPDLGIILSFAESIEPHDHINHPFTNEKEA